MKKVESDKSIILEHLEKWQTPPGPARWMVIDTEADPKLSSDLRNHLKIDAEKVARAIRPGTSFKLFTKKPLSLDEVFNDIFVNITNDLKKDPQQKWLQIVSRNQNVTPQAARLEVIKSYLFALQGELIIALFKNMDNFAHASAAEKEPIKTLLKKAAQFYEGFNQTNSIDMVRQRSGAFINSSSKK